MINSNMTVMVWAKTKKTVRVGVILFLCIAVFSVFAMWLFYSVQPKIVVDQKELESAKGLPIEQLTDEQREARIADELGVTSKQLAEQELTADSLEDFTTAYKSAQYLMVTDSKKSLQAFKVADNLGSKAQKTADFYAEYAEAADNANQYKLGTEIMRKELAVVKETGYDFGIENLENTIRLREDMYE